MASVTLRGVRKDYGPLSVISGIDLDVADREFTTLVGPSGCGKSTLLRMIAGLESVSGGDISIGAERVNDMPPMHRDVAMVFQSYALYPHMTVAENIGFGLRLRRVVADKVAAAVTGAAAVLNLGPLLGRRPGQLSGGQRQRVAMGRAMVRNPRLFLFDEPLSNLDAKLRVQMRAEIKALHRRLGSTSIYVTHDQVEAMTMADRIIVMNGGRIEQQGTPETLYDRPATLFVAGFIGSPSMNLIPGVLKDGRLVLEDGATLPFPHGCGQEGQAVTLGVRPEAIRPAQSGTAAEVVDVEPTGVDTLILCRFGGVQVTASVRDRFRAPPGTPIQLAFDEDSLHGFDTATGQTLRP
ncbi:MAG: ABC transporter ATP-binding protein [Janthinobacterium lividum]